MNDELILERMKNFIETEGLRKDTLAKRLKMTEKEFADHLNGYANTKLFSKKLALIRGFKDDFFESVEFDDYLNEVKLENARYGILPPTKIHNNKDNRADEILKNMKKIRKEIERLEEMLKEEEKKLLDYI